MISKSVRQKRINKKERKKEKEKEKEKEKGERKKEKGHKKKARPTEYLLTGADPTYIDIVVPRRKSVMHANAHYTLYFIH